VLGRHEIEEVLVEIGAYELPAARQEPGVVELGEERVSPGGTTVLNTTSAPDAMMSATIRVYSVWSSGKYSSPTISPPRDVTRSRTFLFSVCGQM